MFLLKKNFAKCNMVLRDKFLNVYLCMFQPKKTIVYFGSVKPLE